MCERVIIPLSANYTHTHLHTYIDRRIYVYAYEDG